MPQLNIQAITYVLVGVIIVLLIALGIKDIETSSLRQELVKITAIKDDALAANAQLSASLKAQTEKIAELAVKTANQQKAAAEAVAGAVAAEKKRGQGLISVATLKQTGNACHDTKAILDTYYGATSHAK